MLNKEEASKCITEMQEIWRRSLKMLEATAVQSLINGDSKSIENGRHAARTYQEIKNTVDQCINVVQKFMERK